MRDIRIKSALISVYYKDGLEQIVRLLTDLGIKLYSTGGTWDFIHSLGLPVSKVEEITGYPSILDGRVKTLHPKIFGGILAKRNEDHLDQLLRYDIPPIDLVVVDLYPFEETVATTSDQDAIIEKIDIGGISLIRAAAKNYADVMIIPSLHHYSFLQHCLSERQGVTTLQERHFLAGEAFQITSHYDTAIYTHFASDTQQNTVFKKSIHYPSPLRYGENPHQSAQFFGDLSQVFDQLAGKELSYNNLVDIDAAMHLMHEFLDGGPTFAVIKHTNACGVSTRSSIFEAWKSALQADPVSAFGGILISNKEIDAATAADIDKIFYEVLIAPSFSVEALHILTEKNKRIILKQRSFTPELKKYRSLLNGVLVQDSDLLSATVDDSKVVTKVVPDQQQWEDLLFANICAKHLKSNTIVFVKNKQLLGMGCGQTSRIDACRYAIEKAERLGLSLEGAVMASDAFFPFPDCVELAAAHGVYAVIQPGGSIKDQLSIDYCNESGIAMVCTGTRHFLH